MGLQFERSKDDGCPAAVITSVAEVIGVVAGRGSRVPKDALGNMGRCPLVVLCIHNTDVKQKQKRYSLSMTAQ